MRSCRAVPKWLDLLLGMEAAATTINTYETILIPGTTDPEAFRVSGVFGRGCGEADRVAGNRLSRPDIG